MLLGFEFDFGIGIGWPTGWRWRPRHATHARRVIKPDVLTREIITPSKTRVHVRTHIQRPLFIAQFRRGNYERSSRTNEDRSRGGGGAGASTRAHQCQTHVNTYMQHSLRRVIIDCAAAVQSARAHALRDSLMVRTRRSAAVIDVPRHAVLWQCRRCR